MEFAKDVLGDPVSSIVEIIGHHLVQNALLTTVEILQKIMELVGVMGIVGGRVETAKSMLLMCQNDGIDKNHFSDKQQKMNNDHHFPLS